MGSSSASRQRMSPRRRTSLDSPSRQLIEEFTHFVIETDRSTKARHDKENEALEVKHRRQLEAAQQHHASVIARAELAHETARQQREAERLRKIVAEKEAFERSRRELAEAEAQRRQQELHALEEKEREQHERLQHERLLAEKEAKLKANEDKARREQQVRAESEAKQRAETEARELAEKAAQEAAAASVPKPQPEQTKIANLLAPSTITATPGPSVTATAPNTVQVARTVASSSPLVNWEQLRSEHSAYINLHGELKKMRKHMLAMYKQAQQSKKSTGRADPPIEEMADMRRQIQKNLGQLTLDSQKNKTIVSWTLFI
jgi:nucleoporin GLE1